MLSRLGGNRCTARAAAVRRPALPGPPTRDTRGGGDPAGIDMKTPIHLLAVALIALALAAPRVAAHHSNVGFAVETVLTANGVVKEWQWTNPHTWLIVMVDD